MRMRLDTGFGESSHDLGEPCHSQNFSTGTPSKSLYFPNSILLGFLTLTGGMTGKVCLSTKAMVEIAELSA